MSYFWELSGILCFFLFLLFVLNYNYLFYLQFQLYVAFPNLYIIRLLFRFCLVCFVQKFDSF